MPWKTHSAREVREVGRRSRRAGKMVAPGGRLPGESKRDHLRFCVYRDLGPRRSLREAARRCGISLARVKQLSSQHEWDCRVQIWDFVQRHRRRHRGQETARAGRARLLQEAEDWQTLARAGLARVVRRGESGELELVRDLTPGECVRLWRVGWEAQQQLMGYGRASPQEASTSEYSEEVNQLLRLCSEAAAHYLAERGASGWLAAGLDLDFMELIYAIGIERQRRSSASAEHAESDSGPPEGEISD